MTILQNYPLVAAMASIFITQATKIPVAYFLKRPVTIALMFSSGGMPSSHSSGVTSLITAIVIDQGWASPLTAIAITFGVLVMFDSMGVRRQSGEHGIIINEMIQDIQLLGKTFRGADKSLQEELEHEKDLNVRLGHKPVEVFFGAMFGIVISLVTYGLFYS